MVLGEVFLSGFVGMLFTKLTSADFVKFITQEGLAKKLENWRKMLLMIQAVLNDAEEKQFADKIVKMWLDDLRDLAYDIEDILDVFDTEALRRKMEASKSKLQNLVTPSCSSLCPQAVKFNLVMCSKVNEITTRLQSISEKVAKLGLQRIPDVPSPKFWRRPPSTCLPNESGICGRDSDKRKIIEKMLRNETSDANFDVISLVGMGGVGKTTLAKLVYNDKALYHFTPKIWVCVSDDFDVMRIAKAILESVTYQPCELKEFNQVQIKLREALTGKRFLLVLDDVWNRNYDLWEVLKSPFAAGARGSKIVVTTRCVNVALTIGSVECHKLELLSDDDCWFVFLKHAFANRDVSVHPNLELVRDKVVQKCRGLPLAARTLGGLLRSTPRDEWENILSTKIWNLPDESDILPVLRLSYLHLPSHLKRCFAYCAVLPKGFEFAVQEIVLLWMCEGLIQQQEDNNQMEKLGGGYFRELVSRSIFQLSSGNRSLYVMHDLVNDLAQWAAGDTYFSLEDALETNKHHHRRARYSSHTRDDYDSIRKFQNLHEMKCLRTFLPFRNGDTRTSYIANNVLYLLPKLKMLRVLNLSGYNITELPCSIGNLRLLRYLNLASTMIRNLPESTSCLYNLQVLILRDCSYLLKLPSKMENLVNLRFLDITNVCLESEMPQGLKNLKHLRILSDFLVGRDAGCRIQDLMNLNFLSGTLRISGLNNVGDARQARQASLNERPNLDGLELKWGSDWNDSGYGSIDKDVLDMLRPHPSLKELTIKCYGGTQFPTWVGDQLFSSVVFLCLENCQNCTSLPPLGLLKSLKDLILIGMSRVKNIGPEFYGDGFSNPPFPALQTLHFEHLTEWRDWHVYDEKVTMFPSLRVLSVQKCSKLLGKLPGNLSSLEKLVIQKCESLSVSISSFPMLQELDISGCQEVICRNLDKFSLLNSITLSHILSFPCLTESFIPQLTNVENLEIAGSEELTALWRLLHNFSLLRCLKIKSCSQLVSLIAEDHEEYLQLGLHCKIEILKLLDCNSLEGPIVLQSLTSLRELHFEKCSTLVSIAQTCLPGTLKNLSISHCENLQFLMTDRQHLLEHLYIRNCQSLTCLSSTGKLPTPLKHLEIWDCPDLDSVAETFYDNMYLEHIEIRNCGKLVSLPGSLNSLSYLQEITMQNCPGIVSFPEGGLPISNLRKLYIGWCQNLKALPEQIQNLTSLSDLDIHACPFISCFPEEGLPTSLSSLSITNLNICGPLFAWGLHRLTSLKRLLITGGCDDVKSFPQEETGMMLPTSLTSLYIGAFPNLKRLSSRGFQNLTLLRELCIFDCPKLASLPATGLPSSLLELYIDKCHLLTQKCKNKYGKEFSKISHMPCVYIDNKFIYDPKEEE